MEPIDDYSLATGDGGAPRLRLVDQAYGVGTRRLLERAGLALGQRVADVGCGIGTVTRWMAARVGSGGRVFGVDVNAEQLEAARRASEDQGQGQGHENLEYIEASAYATGLPRGSLDLVYCRFLLMHLTRPIDALREMRALLRPGGVLVCEEAAVDSSACEPPCAAQVRLQSLATALGAQLGCDFNLGRRLHSLMLEAGFASPETTQHQPVFVRGQNKRLEELCFREIAPRLVAARLATAVEVDEALDQVSQTVANETVAYSLSNMVQVWAKV